MDLTATATMFNADPVCENKTIDPGVAVLNASLETFRQEESIAIVFGCRHFNVRSSSFKNIFEQ